MNKDTEKEYQNLLLLKDIKHTPKIINYNENKLSLEILENYVSIEEYIKSYSKDNIQLFYNIYANILHVLDEIHSVGLIHKNINSKNILINIINNEVFISDFSRASLIEEKVDINTNINEIQTDFSFISPEQTGRINREVNYQSDYYSLGIVFYNILTNSLPFVASDNLGLVYKHISEKITDLSLINENISKNLSLIIIKMLEKEPRNRYLTISGICFDIEQSKDKSKLFTLGEKDFSSELKIKHYNYGRVHEIAKLENIFSNTINNGNSFVSISGSSGTGKSTLVYELHKLLSKEFGFFANSKFDQINASSTYYGLIKTIDDYFDFVLKNNNNLNKIKNDLLDLLGKFAYLLTSKIKNLSLLLGEVPVYESTNQIAQEENFYKSFEDLMVFITSQDVPLLFFIDDMQWSDIGTIQLIEFINKSVKIKNLLIICAYRDDEVDDSHSYIKMLNTIIKDKNIHTIHCENLDKASINTLITEMTYNQDKALTDFIYNVSNGNIFCVTQIVEILNHEKIFKFNGNTLKFDYLLDDVKSIGLSNDIIEITTKNIKTLNENAISILKIASVIGNKFTIELLELSISAEYNIEEDLNYALEKKLILKQNDIYKFAHDKIQQSFYDLISKDELEEHHKEIAYNLYSNKNDITFFDNIDFEIVSHYNIAIKLLSREELAIVLPLNYKVAFQIKEALAYEDALKLLEIGLSFVDPNDEELYWKYLYLKLEIFYNIANFDAMDKVIEIISKVSKTDVKITEVAGMVIKKYFIQNKYREAIVYGAKILKKFGVNLPLSGNKATVFYQMGLFKYNFRGKEFEEILDLPAMTDKKQNMIAKIIFELIASAYLTNGDLFATYCLMLVNIGIKHGNSTYIAFGYSLMGILYSAGFKKFDAGYRIGQVAIKVSEEYPGLVSSARIQLMVGDFLIHPVLPYKEFEPYNKKAEQGLIESGDTLFRNYNDFFTRVQSIFLSSDTIDNIITDNNAIFTLYKSSNEYDLIQFQSYIMSFLLNMQNKNNKNLLEHKYNYEENKFNDYLGTSNHGAARGIIYTFKALEAYMNEDYKDSLKFAKISYGHIDDHLGTMTDQLLRLIYNLSYLESQSFNLITKAVYAINKSLLKKYTMSAPKNFSLYYNLLIAQESRYNNTTDLVIKHFSLALKDAKESKSLFNIAFTNELIAKYWFDIDKFIAKGYFNYSIKYYNKYGAYEKVDQLEKTYNIQNNVVAEINVDENNKNSDTSFDIQTILKVSQTIAQEVKLDNILKNMSNIIVENIGANKCYIILNQSNENIIYLSLDKNEVIINNNKLVHNETNISLSIIDYVINTKETVIVENAYEDNSYINDEYIQKSKSKSILAIPLIRSNIFKGILYCENDLIENIFSKDSLQVLSIILPQLLISIDNAFIYENLEDLVLERTLKLQNANNMIDKSIDFASIIQDSFNHNNQDVEHFFNDYFTMLEQKENVGGDLIIFEKLNDNECLILDFDCTSHGVPGAFVSMIVHTLYYHIIKEVRIMDVISTSDILSRFNVELKTLLKQNNMNSKSNVGFDGQVMYYNKKDNFVKISSAHNHFFVHENNVLTKIKGDRHSVGYKKSDAAFKFMEHEFYINDMMKIYLLSDGFPDQLGGDKNFPLGINNTSNWIKESINMDMKKQEKYLFSKLAQYRDEEIQNDDISFIGLEINYH